MTVNFNTGGSVSSNSAGNVYTFNLNGIKVTLTSYSLSGNNNTTFQAGTLYQWSVGMGVCGANEGTNCSSPEHQIDNNGAVEMVLMQFSSPIDPTLITIQPYGTSSSGYDRDVTYYLGTGTGTINLSGKSLADLAALGFSSANNSDSTVSTAARSVAISGGAVTSLLFGARVGNTDGKDYFKLVSMTADYNPTPEPATYALVGLALAGVGLWRRKA